MNVYEYNGFKDREEYLACLSEIHDVDIEVIKEISDFLGESEDFDSLITYLDDFY